MSLAKILFLAGALFLPGINLAAAQDAPKNASKDAAVQASQPVITVHGLCAGSTEKAAKNPASCSKVITRKEFEDLMNALNPSGQALPESARQNLAQAYVDALAFEEAARNSGLEETPQFRLVMDWVRLRTMSDLYRRNLQDKYRNPPPEEVDAYYHQHLGSFERIKLQRVLVPREDSAAKDKAAFEQKALDAANVAHTRAAKGDEIAVIQKDVYSTLGLESPPATELGTFRRADFTEKEGGEVFALKPGEVSQVETEPKTYVIYKVVSRETPPLEQLKTEIARDIFQQKLKDAIKSVTDSAHADFNEQYFGPIKPPPQPIQRP